MDDKRKEQLKKLNIKKIQPNGVYMLTDRKGNLVSMTRLTIDDIRYLRWYHGDKNIAYKVNVPPRSQTNKKSSKRNLKVSRTNKYNTLGYRIKEGIKFIGKRVVIFGLVVVIGVGIVKYIKLQKPSQEPEGAYITMSDDYDYDKYMEQGEAATEDVDEEYVQEVERADFIKILCQIYQVDYNTTYNKLVEMTDNFSDPDYLAGKNALVTCKGFPVEADSEEEFLVYAVRIFAQDPGRLDLSRNQVNINNGYKSSTNYREIIAKWSAILDVDPALVYGIIQAETGWNSEMFMEDNNPAGLKNGSSFWKFHNKEEGIIELMMEIVKYRYKGATTIEEISRIHCPINDPDDVNGLNRNWVSNVTAGYEQGREIFESMGFYKNNGLSY